jgi:SAM-dependent methyltransferase
LSDPVSHDAPRLPLLLNAGCGDSAGAPLPGFFQGWRQLRVDVNEAVQPDLLASITDLSAIPDGSVDAIWSAHCIEHLYAHEVPLALAEFHRVLNDTGFACLIVPDLQSIADWLAQDRLQETLYESAAGPVTAHDMLWGFGPAIARGEAAMAHRCGFTPTLFLQRLQASGFAEIAIRRRSNLELAALALRRDSGSPLRREALLECLDL